MTWRSRLCQTSGNTMLTAVPERELPYELAVCVKLATHKTTISFSMQTAVACQNGALPWGLACAKSNLRTRTLNRQK